MKAAAIGALALVCAAAAGARDLPYGAVTDAAVRRCDALHWSAQREAARSCYRSLVAQSGDPAVRAEAAWALGDLKSANDWFRDALAANPASAGVRERWGELYIDTHQEQEALNLFKEALQRDPRNAFAKVGAASVLVDEFAAEAATYLTPVLNDTGAAPGARLRALLLSARAALEDSDTGKAAALLEQAGAVASQAQLPQLELDALRAALDFMNGANGERWIESALKEDPAFGDAYAVPAHFYVISRRQREAIALYQKAVRAQPDLWSARVELASCLLRENRLTEARVQLEAAYQGDPYDPITSNTLRLLDSLRNFDVLVYPGPVEPGATGAGSARADRDMPALILRVHKKESAVLAPYARQLAQRAIATYSERYRFKLREPVVIEIYPDHADFAVRTAGLPGIGLLGVTFGYLLAMDSPSSRPVNEFHWGTTLWHEMAHVFTLESTDHRVPRWLSEGLSVFEEWRTGPIKGMEIPGYVFTAFAQDKALPVADLDRGFVRPEYPEQVQVSYMQAGLICDFIDRSFGFDKLRDLLQQFTHTSDTPQAITAALGISAAEFDRRFRADLQQQFGTLLHQLPEWNRARAAANAAQSRSDWEAAIANAKQALALWAQDVEDGSPYVAMAASYAASNRNELAQRTLEDYWSRGGHDPQALKFLAKRLEAANRRADAVAVLQSINYVAPFDYELHGELGDGLLELGRNTEALAEYQAAMALDPPDLAQAHYRLARAQFALGAQPETRKQLLAALEIAPNFEPAQRLLLQIDHQ
ncbi:MAG: peptidase MA family metallohydrolase [Steroidobacterales bacterium]